jgi:acyl-coenzyme A synthetase/AMP-(fatty) acid ligase
MVSGPTVMVGYWGQPKQGEKPYATGDLVRLLDDGNYLYIGRRDQQVKVRGHRIELGEIEIVLEGHPAIHEAAVLVRDTGFEARLVACVVFADGAVLSLLEIKKLCSQHLPRYMIIDDIYPLFQLPRTRNGKVDRLVLSRLLYDLDALPREA